MSCSIFTKSLLQDVSKVEDADIDISWLRSLIPPFNSDTSGIWQPIWITPQQSKSNYVSPLFPARNNGSKNFDVCNCSDSQINNDPLYQDESNIGLCSYCDNDLIPKSSDGRQWKLYDSNGNSSPRSYPISCCGGGCDTMSKSDDYIPKIPYLNHAYITGAVDSKHHREFPACSNPYLGCENFITHNKLQTISGAVIRADWRIQETISEIPYEKFSTQHDSEHMHNMSYQKSKSISSTCGNFIMLSLPDNARSNNFYWTKYPQLQNLIFSEFPEDTPSSGIPKIEDFKAPYGFDRETYKNIIINNEKIASYWKWNYTSGILCWYRYFANENTESIQAHIKLIQVTKDREEAFNKKQQAQETLNRLTSQDRDQNAILNAVLDLQQAERNLQTKDFELFIASAQRELKLGAARIDDKRPIRGVDLYISPGDVFFAKNDGPEPQGNLNNPFSLNGLISTCPSGLKVVKGGDISCIIPSGSNFAYISANIYDRFHNLYYRTLDSLTKQSENNDLRTLPKRAFMTAAILCTAPQYDEITVDLFKNLDGSDEYVQNQYNQIDILNKDMLKETVYDSVSRLNYISNKTELFDTIADKYGAYLWIPSNSNTTLSFDKSINSSFAVSLNFDLSLSKSDINRNIWRTTNCIATRSCSDRTFTKNFSYEQNIGYSLTSIKTTTNEDLRHAYDCSDGTITPKDYGFYSNIYLNQSIIKSKYTSNGCYTISGIYPRIAQSSDTTFCRNCDQYSSFYLIPGADSIECTSHSGVNSSQSFCYETLARTNQDVPSGTFREERRISDGTKRLVRSYRASFLNPYLDSVAFHPDNGVFVNSYPYGLDKYVAFEQNVTSSDSLSNNIYVNFNTKNLAIKIYDLELEYIQTQNRSTQSCKRFPVNEKCKCSPIVSPDTLSRPADCSNPFPSNIKSSNVFTPSLSTKYTARLQKYGGYSQEYLDQLFGQGVVTAGGVIPIVASYSSPINAQKCDSSDSITLYNYTNSNWKVKINNLDPEAELYLTVNEFIDITAPSRITVFNRGETDGDIAETYSVTNQIARRFTNKVTVNDRTVLYARETTRLPNITSQELDIKIQNPFLSNLMASRGGDAEAILYPPSGKLLAAHIFSYRGDESTAVTLTFKQYFKRTKLLFNIPSITPMGTLKRGSFNPNSGLSNTSNNKTPIKNNWIYYANELFDTDQLLDGSVYYGELNEKAINVINSLNEYDMHKKLRLYLKINNKWYYYTGSNIGSFMVNNVKYPGLPTLFEYTTKEKSKVLPSMLPSPVKKHIEFQFINNHVTPILSKSRAEFPYLFNDVTAYGSGSLSANTIGDSDSSANNIDGDSDISDSGDSDISDSGDSDSNSETQDYYLRLEGMRHYFMIPEKDAVISIDVDSIQDVKNLSFNFANLEQDQAIVLNNGTRWIVKNPQLLNDPKSYEYKPFDYWAQYYSDLSIDFRNIDTSGLVANSKKPCDFDIKLITDRNITHTRKIVEKSIFCSDGLSVPYTVFKLQNPSPRGAKLINVFDDGVSYLTIGQINSPRNETSPLLNNKYLPGKWGDVVDYDNELVDPIINSKYDINKIFPKSSYNNWLYKIIVNNYSKEYIYKVYTSGNIDGNNGEQEDTPQPSGQLLHIPSGSLIYYCILHPYAVGAGSLDTKRQYEYQNFVPLIDLNILELDESISKLNIPNSGSGTIKIANIAATVDPAPNYIPYTGYSGESYFWVPIESGRNLQRTFVPVDTFYNDTLRLDNPIYWISRINRGETLNQSEEFYRAYFRPRSMSTSVPSDNTLNRASSFQFVTVDRSQPFWKYPIYGDKDDGTCDNIGCYGDPRFDPADFGIAVAGYSTLSASYKIAQDNEAPPLNSTNIQFALGYDAGLYNLAGNSMVTIERFELNPNNIIDRNIDQCSSDTILPDNYDINPMSPVFQNVIRNATQRNYPMDDAANEMLFRILYGENTFVNKKMYFIDNIVYDKQDVISYTDPRTTAEDIYSQILYNYDKSANNPIKIEGSFDVMGVLDVGASATITINSVKINLAIVNINNVIYIRYSGPGISDSVMLHQVVAEDSTYLVQVTANDEELPEPQPEADNISITYLTTLTGYTGYSYGLLQLDGVKATVDRALTSIPNSNTTIMATTMYSTPLNWSGAHGNGSFNAGDTGQCANGQGSIFTTRRSIPPRTTAYNYRQFVCGQEQLGLVFFRYGSYRNPTFCVGQDYYPWYLNYGDCAPFEFGFCRKNNCPTCEETLVTREQINFTYDWRYCRTNFNTFGHIHRLLHEFDTTQLYEPIEDQICLPNDPCNPNSPITCTPVQYPEYAGSRASFQQFLIENALTGQSSDVDPICGNPTEACCIPLVGAVPECNENSQPIWICVVGNNCALGTPPDCGGEFNGCWEGSMTAKSTDGWLGVPPCGRTCDPATDTCSTPDCCNEWSSYCGVVRYGDGSIYKHKIFKQTFTYTNPYTPSPCGGLLCSVNYNNKSIILNIAGKQICLSTFITRCPNISITSNMNNFYITDSIESNCDECLESSIKIDMPPQKMKFVTKIENRKCLMGTLAVCDANPRGGGWSVRLINPGGGLAGDDGFGGRSYMIGHQCGGGTLDFICGKIGKLLSYSDDPTYNITYECEKSISCGIPSTLAPYEIEENQRFFSLILEDNNILPGRLGYYGWSAWYKNYLGKGASDIPLSDIIEGVVPGSVSSLITESYNAGGEKVTRLGGIVSDISTVYVFYYTYQYIRPVTIADVLRNDEDIICGTITPGPIEDIPENIEQISKCGGLPFPNAYAANFWSSLWSRWGSDTNSVSYTIINPTYEKDPCQNSLSCYYDHKVLICGDAGIWCDVHNGLRPDKDQGACSQFINLGFNWAPICATTSTISQGITKIPCYDNTFIRYINN